MPSLSSRSSATAKLFLDFDGAPASSWDGQAVPTTPAFDLDGDATTFTTAELAAIQQIWARVAEAYSPFNLDVTTLDPGNRDDKKTAAVVIGGDGTWTGNVGGISRVAGFSSALYSNTAYVFPSRLGLDVKTIALGVTHEAGHNFGLQHQSTYSGTTLVNEYNSGTVDSAPIMGVAYSSNRGLWWYGQSLSWLTYQDDLAVISGTGNGFGYRLDDHASSRAAADALTISGGSAAASGVIEQTSDQDWFGFTTTGGSVNFTGAVAQYGAMLDLKLELRDMNGNLVTSVDSSSLGETISANVAAGTYYLVVASHGSYGDVGPYAISGTVPRGAPPAPVAVAGGSGATT